MIHLHADRRLSWKLEPLFKPSRYKGLHGGRGSGKSHFFAEQLAFEAVEFPARHDGAGMRAVCIREVQKSLKESAKRLIEDKIQAFGLGRFFEIRADSIVTPGGGIVMFQGMQDHTAESIKSLEGVNVAWVEEAQTLTERSLELLRPTIRAPGSELWFSWNPRRPTDPVDRMLRGPNKPSDAVVVEMNWNDNPQFPAVLEQERVDCAANDPDKYGHIWNGEYARVYEGAYFAPMLEAAERDGRIEDSLRPDPLVSLKCYWDIGSTGRHADATSIWVTQHIGGEVRWLDYYEAIGQELAEHVGWLRRSGYEDALQVLPHDGRRSDTVHRVTVAGALGEAGFTTRVMPNAGSGAAVQRIEAMRRILPVSRFDRRRTEAGRDALAWYHERRDAARGVGLGPEHDWASHAADAAGMCAMDFLSTPPTTTGAGKSPRRNLQGYF